MLSDVTEIWQLYFGLMFIAVVMFAPGGLAGLLMMHAPLLRARVLHRLAGPYFLLLAAALIAATGVILGIELAHHLMAKASDGSVMRMFGLSFDAARAWPWLVAAMLVAGGALLTRVFWPMAAQAWNGAIVAARSSAQS
jgi:branched-chain amino acid transport system permease protein